MDSYLNKIGFSYTFESKIRRFSLDHTGHSGVSDIIRRKKNE